MAKVLLTSGSDHTIAASVTRYQSFANSGGGGKGTATEIFGQITFRVAGTLSEIGIRLETNTSTGAGTIVSRKNTANGNQSVSVGAGLTGEFRNTGGTTDTVAAGDEINNRIISGSGGSWLIRGWWAVFAATSNTAMIGGFQNANHSQAINNTTMFFPLGAQSGAFTSTANRGDFEANTAGTMKFLFCEIRTNTRGVTDTVRSRKNGANGNMSISIGSNLTGIFEDTTNTDAVSAGDHIGTSFQGGASATSVAMATLVATFETTNDSFLLGATGASSNIMTVSGASERWWHLSPDNTSETSSAEEVKLQQRAVFPFDISEVWANLSSNSIANTSTLYLRKNLNDTIGLSITASTTGEFQSSTPMHCYAEDMLNWHAVGGAGGGSLLIVSYSAVATTKTDTRASTTKSLKYTVLTEPAAITKSLKYTVRAEVAAITKDLQYAVRPEVGITKSLKYAVTAEVAVTKSLKYTVVTETAAVQKSMTYAVVTEQAAITKGLTYAVATEAAIQKDLTYAVQAEVATTKDLKYTVVAPAAEIQKSMTYTVVVEGTPITKSLTYSITTVAAAITKDLQYEIVNATTELIEKSLTYAVAIEQGITKGLVYLVKAAVAVQKSLKYTVVAEAWAITKALSYHILTKTGVQKSLQYAVKVVGSVTKGLTYAVETPVSITKSLRYAVQTEAAVQKSLTYEVISEVAITKPLTYAVVSEAAAVQKALEYRVVVEHGLTKGLAYEVITEQAITKELVYVVVDRIAILKGLTYSIVTEQLAITKPLRYAVAAENVIGKSMTYEIRRYPYVQKPDRPYTPGESPYVKTASPFTRTTRPYTPKSERPYSGWR